MRLTDFAALSFDCYGTLIDWETGLRTALQSIADLTPTDSPVTVDTLLETYADAESTAERAFPTAPYPEIIAHAAIATGTAHGIIVPEAVAAQIGASVPEWPAFPDSAEALARLTQRFKLIILSNVDRTSFAASNAKLGVTFDAIYTAEDIGSYKPDPRNFAYLLDHIAELDIPSDRLLHVAQSLFHDHVPAKATGLPTIWIDRRGTQEGHGATPIPTTSVQPDWTFPSMAAFAEAVEAELG